MIRKAYAFKPCDNPLATPFSPRSHLIHLLPLPVQRLLQSDLTSDVINLERVVVPQQVWSQTVPDCAVNADVCVLGVNGDDW